MALLHRVGPVAVGETSVVVVASSGHRPEAFDAARFAIDRLKATVPIWKREAWEGGEDWGLDATPLDATPLGSSDPAAASPDAPSGHPDAGAVRAASETPA